MKRVLFLPRLGTFESPMQWRHAFVNSEIVSFIEGQKNFDDIALWVVRIPRCPAIPECAITLVLSLRSFPLGTQINSAELTCTFSCGSSSNFSGQSSSEISRDSLISFSDGHSKLSSYSGLTGEINMIFQVFLHSIWKVCLPIKFIFQERVG